MSHFIVAGITQLETVIRIDEFPIEYAPLTSKKDFIYSGPGGDAFNVALALRALEDEVSFMTVVGRGQDLGIFNPPHREIKINTDYILPLLESTPHEVIFYQDDSHRQVFEDLKNIREAKYDMTIADPLIAKCDMIILSNANFCRPFLESARIAQKPVAVRIHNFSREKERYNIDFLGAASILYFSGGTINAEPFDFVREMADKYDPDIILYGQQLNGVILYVKKENLMVHYKIPRTVETVDTQGAGNALLACFLHYYQQELDATNAIRNALLFSSYHNGYNGTSEGFLTPDEIEQWKSLVYMDTNAMEK